MKDIERDAFVVYVHCFSLCILLGQNKDPCILFIYDKGRHQITSVETGDFLQKNAKSMLMEFCRSVTPSPHVRVKGHLGDNSQLLLCYTW